MSTESIFGKVNCKTPIQKLDESVKELKEEVLKNKLRLEQLKNFRGVIKC